MPSSSSGGGRSGFAVGFELFPYAVVAALGVPLVVTGVWEHWVVLGGHDILGWQRPSCPGCGVGRGLLLLAVGIVLVFAGTGGAAYRVLRVAETDGDG